MFQHSCMTDSVLSQDHMMQIRQIMCYCVHGLIVFHATAKINDFSITDVETTCTLFFHLMVLLYIIIFLLFLCNRERYWGLSTKFWHISWCWHLCDTYNPVTVLVCRRSSEATSLFRDVVIKRLRSESSWLKLDGGTGSARILAFIVHNTSVFTEDEAFMCYEGSEKREGTSTNHTDFFYELVTVEEFQFVALH